MFGTRDLFIKGEKISEVTDSLVKGYVDQLLKLSEQHPNEKQEVVSKFLKDTLLEAPQNLFFLNRLYQQAKQLSQIIAYIWLNAGSSDIHMSDTAKQLEEYFIHPTEENSPNVPGGKLKYLLKANPKDNSSEENVEAKLLREVFKDYQSNENLIFPIFNDFELENDQNSKGLGYLFEVNVNAFNGVLEDVDRNSPSLFKFVIPFPPRPQIGEGTVTYSELEHWIADRKEGKYFADNPYIPTTCS
ncbi:hypothetical protein NSTCB13_03397 [Nostoc sp. DSM 114160]|jgi:hypothetical protein